MRIRKHAAKLLLGSACPPPQHYSPPPPPPPPPPLPPGDDEYDLQSVGDDGLFLCQLNCSPWDVLDSNRFYFQHQQEEEEEEEDEGKGIMGNVLGFGDEEGIFGISVAVTKSSSSVVVAAEPYFNFKEEEEDGIDGKNNVKKRRRRKKKEKEKENRRVDGHGNDDRYSKGSSVVAFAKITGSSVAAGMCKKNDGKGWHCNRPANPNHTLCDHHLAQLKSYSSTRCNNNNSSNNVGREAADGHHHDSVSGPTHTVKNQKKQPDVLRVEASRRPKTKTAVTTDSKSAGNGYYYYSYSGFGLQWGKTRSNGGKEDAKAKELAGNNESESGDGSDAPIAGDDLDDDDDDTDDDEGVKFVGNVDSNKGRIKRKKRGRKPIKARSLKSLM